MSGYSSTDPRTRPAQQQPQPQEAPTPQGIEKQGNNLMIPMEQVQKAAETYAKYKPMLGWVSRAIGFKIPKELDDFLTSVGSGEPVTPEKVQEMQELDVEPRVGQPVMTFKMAKDAWLMHNEGMGTRAIAQEFTNAGSPVSFQTVARWINDYDAWLEEKEESRAITVFGALRKIGKWLLVTGLLTAWIWVIQHFF